MKALFECECGLGFGNCEARPDTLERYKVASTSVRGAKMKAKKLYNEYLASIGWASADTYGFVCKVFEVD